MPQEDLQKFYKAGSQYFNLGSYEDFVAKMQDEGKRRKFYDTISQHYNVGDYETFTKRIKLNGKVKASPSLTSAVVKNIKPTATANIPGNVGTQLQIGEAAINALDFLGSKILGAALPDAPGQEETFTEALERGRRPSETAPGQKIIDFVTENSLLAKAGILSKEAQRKATTFAVDFMADLTWLVPFGKFSKAKELAKAGEIDDAVRIVKEAAPSIKSERAKQAFEVFTVPENQKILDEFEKVAKARSGATTQGKIKIRHYATKEYRPKHDKPTSFFRTDQPIVSGETKQGIPIETPRVFEKEAKQIVDAEVPAEKIYQSGSGKNKELDRLIENSPDFQNDTRFPKKDWAENDKKIAKILEDNNYLGFQYPKGSQRQNEVVILDRSKIKSKISKPVSPEFIESAQDFAKTITEPPQELGKYAKNINLNRLDLPEQIKGFEKKIADAIEPTLDKARRGKVTFEQQKELADQLGMTPEKLLKRKKGQAFNAEQALAARAINAKAVNETWEIANKFAREGGRENLAEFIQAFSQYGEVMKQTAGLTAEAGRALGSFRISVSGANVNKEQILKFLTNKELRIPIEEIAEHLGRFDPNDIVGMNKFLREAIEASTKDKIFEVWINALLSNPTTHFVNTISNTLTALSGTPERFMSAAIDLGRSAIKGAQRERFFSELAGDLYGWTEGLKDGAKRAIFAWQNELSMVEAATKIDVGKIGAVGGKVGKAVRIPTRALIAADEFFKGVNQTIAKYGYAIREARKLGLKGKELDKKMVELIQDPNIIEKAIAEAQYRTFTNPLGKAGNALFRLRENVPGLQYVIPFLRTPLNVAKFGLKRSPLYWPVILRRVAKGGLKGGELSEEAAKALMGTMAFYTVFQYAADGKITGSGPTNRAQRQALRNAGWQPYSFKVGDRYIAYGRLEPLGMTVGLAADMAEAFENMNDNEKFDVISKVSTSIGQNITNKTFMQGLSDAINALSFPERYGERWTQRFSGTVVPNIAAGTARALDPNLRQVNGILDAIKERVPGVSKTLEPRLNIWGDPIKRTNVGITAFSPIYVSAVSKDPVDREVVRLNLGLGLPSRNLTVLGDRIELTDKEYNNYVRNAGKPAKQKLRQIIKSEEYQRLNDETRITLIEDIIRAFRRAAAAKVHMEYIKSGKVKPKVQ